MFRSAFKTFLTSEFAHNWSKCNISKSFKGAPLIPLAKNDFLLSKVNQIHSLHCAYPSTQFYSKSERPAILLGGILSFIGINNDEESEASTMEVIKKGIMIFLGLEKSEGKDSELITTIKRGILLIKRKKYEKAEQMLHLALKMAQDLNDEEGITYVYDVMANLAFEIGQYQKSEKLFVTVLQRLLANGEAKDSNKVVEISLKLAKIFEAMKDVIKAEQGYKFCLDTLNKKLESDDKDTLALWGMSMDWYARFLLGVNRKSEALNCLRKAHGMCVRVNGIEHEQTVVLLNDLGTVCSLMGDNESAVRYLEEARDLVGKIPDMKDAASIYINLGQLYLLREMIKESKEACLEGMKLARYQSDDIAVAEAKQCLDKIKEALKGGQNSKEQFNSSPTVVVH